jgi:hypothetical protein
MNPRRKITVPGASGALYKFTVHPLGTPLPESGAVYLITHSRNAAAGRQRHARIFAGQAENLAARVSEQGAMFGDHQPNCVCVLPEPSRSERERIEDDLLAKFRPPCNGPAGV